MAKKREPRPVSLAGVPFEEALRDLLVVKPESERV